MVFYKIDKQAQTMSDEEPEKKEYAPPVITRGKSFDASRAEEKMLAGSPPAGIVSPLAQMMPMIRMTTEHITDNH
jgi:hypothetical protein